MAEAARAVPTGRGGDVDAWLAAVSAASLGGGAFLAVAGWFSGESLWLFAAAALAGPALFVLLAAGWLDPLPVVIASLPLPALYATDAARASPALFATALAVGAWLLRVRPGDGSAAAVPIPRRSGALFLGGLSAAAVFALQPLAALRELLTMFLLAGLFVLAARALAGDERRIANVARILAAVAGLAGALAVLESVGVLPGRFPLAGTGLARASGGFGWPNELAMFLAMSLPLAVFAWSTAGGAARWAWSAAPAACVLGLLATFSRGSWLACLFGTTAFVLLGRWRTGARVWIAALGVAVVVDALSGGAISGRAVATFSDPLVGQRLLLMQAGATMFFAQPLVGVGPGGFSAALDQYGLLVGGLWDYVGSAHNTFLHVAAEAGVLGLLPLAALYVAVLVRVLRGARERARSGDTRTSALAAALTWSLLTAAALAMVEWSFAQGVGQVVALIAAMGLAFVTDVDGIPRPSR